MSGADDIIDAMARLKGARQPFALATVVRTRGATAAKVGAKALVREDGSTLGWVGGGCVLGAARKAAGQALADGRARLIRVRSAPTALAGEVAEEFKSGCPSGGAVEVFVEPVLPRPALLVAGGSPVARALCDLARRTGFAVTVAALPGDLEAFAEADGRIEGFAGIADSPAAARFVVVATQGRRDREALEAALAAPAPYVAFVGSRRKAAALTDQLAARGVDRARLAALRAPAGLDIGARGPEEIALSILAEIVQAHRAGAPAEPIEEEVIEGATVETEVVPAADRGCCGEAGGA